MLSYDTTLFSYDFTCTLLLPNRYLPWLLCSPYLFIFLLFNKKFLSTEIYCVYWLRLGSKEAGITISEEERAMLVQGIIDSTLRMMERIITTRSPKKSAMDSSKPYQQSKTAITNSTIFFNILTDAQQFPARPRDFRASLADGEKDIGMAELSDILSIMVRQHLLEPKRNNLSFPRGRPKSNTGIVDERRGRLSYYEQSKLKQMAYQILNDP